MKVWWPRNKIKMIFLLREVQCMLVDHNDVPVIIIKTQSRYWRENLGDDSHFFHSFLLTEPWIYDWSITIGAFESGQGNTPYQIFHRTVGFEKEIAATISIIIC